MSLEQQEGERKLVSVLFADIAGFTALSETMDAEPVRDLLNDLYDQLVPVIERYEGTVDKFMGDCLMAVFGAPTAHEDDAERSVRAGIDMRSTLARFNGERGLNLSIHIGINTGRVIAGAVGGRGRWDYSVIGDAVNVASRLEEASAPGDILIGPDTHRLTSHAFLDESAGIIDVRGRSEAVPIYRLLGQRPRVARKRSAGRVDASLVGRDTEMEMLRSALAGLTLGVGGALFLLGEAGVGKSRLVAEARADTAFASIRWLEGRALSYEETTGYPPFKEIIETDAQIDVADGHVERQHKAALRVSALLPAEAESVSQHVTGILGTGIPGDFAERLRYMNDDAVRTEFLGAIRSYFGALARKSPVVLVFEDAHWLDPRSGRLVQELIPLARTHAVLFCFVARSGPHRAVLDSMDCARNALRSRFHEIHVMPLTAIDTAELAKNLLPGAEIPTTVIRGIQRRAEGNPFFVEEIVRHLIDGGALMRGDSGRWQLNVGSPRITIPDTIRGVIMARIDLLPETARRHLRQASVIGRKFPFRILVDLAGTTHPQLHESLALLEKLQLVQRCRTGRELEYVFKHDLVHETTYEGVLLRTRKELHGRVARALEEHYSELLEESYGLVAYHYSRAEDWQRAQDYLLKAGQQATILSGEPEALAQYRQALDALLRAFDETWRTPSIADPVAWLVERVELFWDLRLLGELLESVQVFHRKVTDTYGLEDPRSLTAAYILAASYLQRDMYSEAGSLLERTLDELKGSEERNEMLLNRVLLLLGICRLNQDRFTEAEHLLSTALEQELSLDIPNDHLVVDASIYLSTAFYFSGRLGQDRGLIEKALAKAHDSRRPQYWELLLNLSSSQLVFGDYSQARDCARRCLDESTSPYIRSHASAHLAAVLHAQEDYAQAQHYYQLAIEGFQSLGRMGEEADAVRDLAETQLQLGEFEEAERAAREAIRLADAAYGTRGYQAALAYWTLAGVAHARKEEDVANAYLEESEKIARQRIAQENPFWAELFFRRALVHSAEGKEDEAREGFRAALRVFGNIGGDRHPRWRSMESLWSSLAPHSP